MEMTHDPKRLASALASMSTRENHRNILTRSQARLADALLRKENTEVELTQLAEKMQANYDAYHKLGMVIQTQEENYADLRALHRGEVETIRSLQNDGVFPPAEVTSTREDDSSGEKS